MFSRKFIIAQIFFALALAVLLFFRYQLSQPQALPVYGQVENFSLINQDGAPVSLSNLKGKIWAADLIFTTCSGICPMMTKHMQKLHEQFNAYPDVRLVSISVNPENDTPEVMKAYAAKQKAKGERWMFLTGSRDEIQKLAVESFKMGDIKDIVFHSSLFVLVDKKGNIRGYYDGTDKERMARLVSDVPLLRKEIQLPLLPTINASLNALAGILLVCGFLAIRRKNINLHKRFMLAAFSASALFLCCYVYYHATSHLVTKYQGQGVLRGIYFFVLGTHMPLAVLIVPFIFMALYRAFRGEFDKHTQITRKLLPVWLYVSLTGVVIYLMLYILPS